MSYLKCGTRRRPCLWPPSCFSSRPWRHRRGESTLSASVPVSAWAYLKGIAKGAAEAARFRKAPAECDRRNALVNETGIGEVAAAARQAPLANVFTHRTARTLPKDLLQMPAGDPDRLGDLFDR